MTIAVDVEARERLAAVENELKHLRVTVDKTAGHVAEMRDILVQAKGAKLTVTLLWVAGSAIVTGLGTAFFALKGFLPKLS